MSTNYITLRNDLARRLQKVPGVISVGLGKKNAQIVLLVAIDAEQFKGNVPKRFQGVDIVLKDLGRAKGQSFGGTA